MDRVAETTQKLDMNDPNYRVKSDPLKWHDGTSRKWKLENGVITSAPGKINPSRRFLALEIEVDGLRARGKKVSDTVKKWGGCIVHDGSLSGNGFEINTAPASGDAFVKQIEEIAEALKSAEAFASNRCGLHCHINCRDLNYYDMRRVVKLYALLENGLYSILHPNRRDSRYCAPCGDKLIKGLDALPVRSDANATKHTLLQNIYGSRGTPPTPEMIEKKKMKILRRASLISEKKDVAVIPTNLVDVKAVKGERHNGSRYVALNMHSWIFRGTLECRMHHGSVNPTNMINWGVLWAGIVDWAVKHKESEVDAIGKIRTSNNRLLEIAPTSNNKEWIKDRLNYWKGSPYLSNEHFPFEV